MKRNFEEEMQKELFELNKLKQEAEESLARAPMGTLRGICRNGSAQYYVKNADNGKTHKQGKYLKKTEREYARQIAQRDYDRVLLKQVIIRINALESLQKKYHENNCYETYDNLKFYRKAIVTPRLMSDEQYVREWESVTYEGKNYSYQEQEIYTLKGERVRSKSEKIIADKLYQKSIPYRYEYPVYVEGMGKVHPDFTCLDVKRRCEIIWEHMGMMGDEDYCKYALKKIENYEKAGFHQGQNIIYSFESSVCPLNTKVVDSILEAYFPT